MSGGTIDHVTDFAYLLLRDLREHRKRQDPCCKIIAYREISVATSAAQEDFLPVKGNRVIDGAGHTCPQERILEMVAAV
jgi:hypothetical protein